MTGHEQSDEDLTAILTAIVRAVPGVVEIYPARPLGLAIADQLVRAALPAVPTAALVSLSRAEGSVSAEIRIAVTENAPAADICRDVYSAVSEQLAARGVGQAEIIVTVARIA